MDRIKKYEPLFGRWYVTKYLGGGSFGSVYQIHSEKDGIKSDSAVKYISIRKQDHVPNAENSPLMETASAGNQTDLKSEDLDSFQMILKKTKREIELLQKLQGHSNIVTIYDYDIFTEESETILLIRMELLTSLSDYMKNHSFDKKEVIRLGVSLCNALESCSQMQIVHRDIKPDNIFVNRSGEFKLGDFGLSCQNMASASQSLRGQKGTPIYMAPESLNWGQKVDHRTDLYAVAIVLYQLLNKGKIPFCADMQDMEALQNAITSRMQKKEMKPPKKDNGILWEIIKKACSYKMEDRYQSANEMKMQLEALLIEKTIVKETSDATNSISNTKKSENTNKSPEGGRSKPSPRETNKAHSYRRRNAKQKKYGRWLLLLICLAGIIYAGKTDKINIPFPEYIKNLSLADILKENTENTAEAETSEMIETETSKTTEVESASTEVEPVSTEAESVPAEVEKTEASPEYDLSDAIRITDFQDLNRIREDLDAIYVLTDDIDLSKCDWEPIGTADEPFTGVLIGNGFTIKGLNIKITASDLYAAGLFACIRGGTVSDLKIDGKIKLTSKAPDNSMASVGILCGILYGGKVEKGTFTGSVNVIGEKSITLCSGGITGVAGENAIISDCEVDADICTSGKYANAMAGGAAGFLNHSSIERCLVNGELTSKNSKACVYAGGVAGAGEQSKISSSVVLLKKITAKGNPVYSDVIGDSIESENNLVISTKENNNTLSATLITSKEKRKKQTYENLGWDFDKVWKMKFFSIPELRHY